MTHATHEQARCIIRFEFLIETATTKEWVQIQGSGGAIGDGCLYNNEILEPSRIKRLESNLLERAKQQQEREGLLRVVRPPSIPDRSFDIEHVERATILEIKGIEAKAR